MKKLIVLMTCLIMLLLAGTADAARIDLAPKAMFNPVGVSPPYSGEWFPGVMTNRGLLFDALSPFTLNSVGIELDLATTRTLTANLYAVTGVDTVGPLLATSSKTFADVGRSWFDIPLSYSFPGTGERYLLSILIEGGEPDDWNVAYYFDGREDPGVGRPGNYPISPPYSVGPVRVFDGTYNLAGPNYLLAHFRMDVNTAQALTIEGMSLYGGEGNTLPSLYRRYASPYYIADGNGQIWNNLNEGFYVLGVSSAPGGPLLNAADTTISGLSFGNYYLYAEPTDLGSHPQVNVHLSDGTIISAMFKLVGTSGSGAAWTRVAGTSAITLGWASGVADLVGVYSSMVPSGINDFYLKIGIRPSAQPGGLSLLLLDTYRQ